MHYCSIAFPSAVLDLDVYVPLMKGSARHHYQVLVKDQNEELKNWHYKDNPRISNIILVADDGYVFQDFWDIIHHYEMLNFPNSK